MKEIQLTQGKVAFVDDDDFELVSQFKWNAYKNGHVFYARGNASIRNNAKRATTKMHRVIMGITDPKMSIDHIDGNGLNNQKSNLRVVTQSQNMMNTGCQKNNTLGVKGVYFDKPTSKYRAHIMVSGRKIHLGGFDDLEKAAEARRQGEIKYYGEFARSNQSNQPRPCGSRQNSMERIEQKCDNPIGIGHLGDDLSICELDPRGKTGFRILSVIPLEKSSIPSLIAALKKYAE